MKIRKKIQVQFSKYTNFNPGFTLIELLVVISIIGMMSTLVIVNFSRQRVYQNLKIAQTELVTNIRKIQNYSLSSRLVNGQPVEYYLLKIDLNNPTQYIIQALYNVSSDPSLIDSVEVVNLPKGVRFAVSDPIVIARPVQPLVDKPLYPNGCALIAYKLPFATTLFSNGCTLDSPGMPKVGTDPKADDYQNILSFQVNSSIWPTNKVSFDSSMVITLTDDKDSSIKKTITIQGVSGLITSN